MKRERCKEREREKSFGWKSVDFYKKVGTYFRKARAL
jgi:hypothetical protein